MTYEQSGEICSLASFTDQFIRERRILKGVSPATEQWYKYSFKAFAPVLSEPYQSTTAFKAAVIARIEALTAERRGNKAVSINTYLRCLKAFLKWCHEEKIIKERIRLSWLKEEEKVLQTLSEEHLNKLISFRAKGVNQIRAQLGGLLICDTGIRLNECLGLCKQDVNFDQCTLKVFGKGRKERLVPFSQEMRKRLYLHLREHEFDYVFCTKVGNRVTERHFQRDFNNLCKAAGITNVRTSPHTLRHTFAVFYLRNGGNLEFLRRYLGHNSLLTTQKYIRSLGVEDLAKFHNQLTPVKKRR